MKKNIVTVLIVILVLSLGLFVSCSNEPFTQTDKEPVENTPPDDISEVSVESITVDDLDDYETIAQTWMSEWINTYKSLPDGDVAQITDGAVDHLKILLVSKPGNQKAFVFSVEVSICPTQPIGSSSYWMAGNTGPSPNRDSSWGQMYREIELALQDDGMLHLVEMGTGGVGHSKGYIEAPEENE